MKFATNSLVINFICATLLATMSFFHPESVYRSVCDNFDFETSDITPPAEEVVRGTAAVWLSFAILAARGLWNTPSRRQDALFIIQMFHFFNLLFLSHQQFRIRPNNINWLNLVFAGAILFLSIMGHRENSKVIAQGDTKQKKIEGGEQKKIK